MISSNKNTAIFSIAWDLLLFADTKYSQQLTKQVGPGNYR